MGAAHIGIGEGLAKCPLQEACKRELAHKLCSRACSRRPVGGDPCRPRRSGWRAGRYPRSSLGSYKVLVRE